jgi:hypothetical protein
MSRLDELEDTQEASIQKDVLPPAGFGKRLHSIKLR